MSISDSSRLAIAMWREVGARGCSVEKAGQVLALNFNARGVVDSEEARAGLKDCLRAEYEYLIDDMRLVRLPKLIEYKEGDEAVMLACVAQLSRLRDDFEMGIGVFALPVHHPMGG